MAKKTDTDPTEDPAKDHGVLYLGIDLGTSRTSVASSNGQRVTLSSHVGYPQGRRQQEAAQEGSALRRRRRAAPPVVEVLPPARGRRAQAQQQDHGRRRRQHEGRRGPDPRDHPARASRARTSSCTPWSACPRRPRSTTRTRSSRPRARRSDSVMLCSEPFAVAYGLDMLDDVLVIDIGAGTTDLCRMHGTMPEESDQLTNTFAGDYVDEQLVGVDQEEAPARRSSRSQMIQKIKERHASVSDNMVPVVVELPVEGKPTPFDITNELRTRLPLDRAADGRGTGQADRDVRPGVPAAVEEPRAARRRRQSDQGPRPRDRGGDEDSASAAGESCASKSRCTAARTAR